MSSDDNDKSTEQVLEYYKKYSQNRNLSKYFSGTSVSYLPPITVENEDERTTQSTAHRKHEIQPLRMIETDPVIVDTQIVLNTSSTDSSSDSPSDHKKLEWDNGADIGYNSARKHCKKKLQKSLSLPILDDLKNLNVPTLVPSTIITHSSSNENLGVLVFASSSTSTSNQTSSKNSARQYPVSSSSVADSPKEQHTYTDSSSPLATTDAAKCKTSTSDSDEKKFENFQQTIDYLKSKIGLPGAQSTPNAIDGRAEKVNNKVLENVKNLKPTLGSILSQSLESKSTIKEKLTSQNNTSNTDNISVMMEVNKSVSQEELAKPSSSSSKPQTKKTMRKVETKIIELSISTPINVNCKGLDRVDKALHTPNEVYPKAVQTDIIQRRHIETQFSFEPNEKTGQKEIRSKIASVSEGTADLASSFEYISVNKAAAVKDNEDVRQVESTKVFKGISGVLKEISLSKSSNESALRLCHEEDIDKHLDLLQKLLKTKKINSSSKRKYIKKLLRQLSELETSNDSSTSSDLFIPKRDPEKERLKFKTKPKVVFKDVEGILSSEGQKPHVRHGNLNIDKESLPISSHSKSSESECQRCITDLASINKISKKLERNQAIEQDISTSDSSKQRTTFADVDNYNIRSSKTSSATSSSKSKPTCSFEHNKFYTTSSLGIELSRSLDKETLNYKTTQSEEPLQKTSPVSDPSLQQGTSSIPNKYLKKNSDSSESTGKSATVKTVSFNRAHTTTDLTPKYSDDYLLKFAENERTYQLNWINNEINHLSKLKNILELKSNKSSKTSRPKTSIYNVIQKDSSDKQSERNYVIETNLNVQPDQLVNYIIDGKEYVVSDSQKSSSDSDKAVIADIEIRSSENQTNIKLRTLCASCKKVECVCSAGNTMHSKMPSLDSEVKTPCSSCQKIVCECEILQESGSNELCSTGSDEARSKNETVQEDVVLKKLPSEFFDIGPVKQEDYNSLQKVFKNCCCTIENTNCSCDFLKRLLTKFRMDRGKISSSNEAVQTENILKAESPVLEPETIIQRGTTVQIKANDEHSSLPTLREVFCKSTQTHHSGVNESTQVSRKSSLKGSQSSNSGGIMRIGSMPKDASEATGTVVSNDMLTEKVLGSLEPYDDDLVKTPTSSLQNAKTTSKGIQVFPNFKSTQTHPSGVNESTQVSQKSSLKGSYQSSNSGGIMRIGSMPKDASEATGTVVSNDIPTEKVLRSLEPFDDDLVKTPASSLRNAKTTSKGIQVFPNFKSTQTHPSGVNESTQVSQKSSLKGSYQSSNSGGIMRIGSMPKDASEATGTVVSNDIPTEKVLRSLEPFDDDLVKTPASSLRNAKTTSKGIQVFPNFDNNGHKPLGSKLKEQRGVQTELEIGNAEQKVSEKEGKQTFVDEATQYSKSTDKSDETAASLFRSGTTSTNGLTSMSDHKSNGSSRITCCCCKQKAFLAEVSYLQDGNDSLAVCSRCYYNRPRYCNHNQRYTCPCQNHCHPKSSGDTQQYCKCCRLEKSKCLRRPRWLAYTVTLKGDGSERRRNQKSSKSILDSINVRKGWSWKSLKNKENYYKKDDEWKSKAAKKRRKKKAVVEDKDEMEKDRYKKNEDDEKDKNEDEEKDIHYTLTEYLIKNRPEFVSSAEYRRQMLLNSRILREQQKEALKLNFLENNLRKPIEANYKLFTESEMRDINKRNYKKLPEIQEKLISQRENRLRHADRLISSIFAKKVQKSVLQGRDNFPIDKPLTSL